MIYVYTMLGYNLRTNRTKNASLKLVPISRCPEVLRTKPKVDIRRELCQITKLLQIERISYRVHNCVCHLDSSSAEYYRRSVRPYAFIQKKTDDVGVLLVICQVSMNNNLIT